MNSTFLRVLAILMAIAAIVTAYAGYRLSHKKPADTLAIVVPSYSQVVARNDIPAGHLLAMEDLVTASTQQQDKQTFSAPQDLIGKTTTVAVMKGAPFNVSQFSAGNLLGQTLAPHERAVAIKVNEIIGVGGFIKPGDHVDVLLYLRADRETGEISSGQVVLTNVKVLAYGTLTSKTESSQNDALTQSETKKLGADNGRSENKNGKDSHSAILAIHANDLSKLMLADSSGVLRLALRGEALPDATASSTTDNQFIALGQVSQLSGHPLSTPAKTTAASTHLTVKKNPAPSSTKRERVIVHQGEAVTVVNVAR